MAKITLEGKEFNTEGTFPTQGVTIPEFTLVDKDLGDRNLAEWQGKKKLISIVPSLDTGVCANSTKKFEQSIDHHPDAIVLVISADLPFAQGRFCREENINKVVTLSMMRSRKFAKDYGVLIVDGPFAGIACRALIVTDNQNKVVYSQWVGEITAEPDYDAALSALGTA